MDSIREQMDLTNEISDAISNPVGMGNMVDEVGPPRRCKRTSAHYRTSSRPSSKRWSKKSSTTGWRVPTVCPFTRRLRPSVCRTAANVSQKPLVEVTSSRPGAPAQADEDDEEAQLRQLQAELAM